MQNRVETFRPASKRERCLCRTLSICFLLITATTATNRAAGATYYLDAVNGNDSNPGTSEEPWQTFDRALPDWDGAGTKVDEGDTVQVAAGDYGELDDDYDEDTGDTGRTDWITYIGDSTNRPVLHDVYFKNTGNAYLKFQNFCFKEPNTGGLFEKTVRIYGDGFASKRTSYLYFDDCRFESDNTAFNRSKTIELKYCDYIWFYDCEIVGGEKGVKGSKHYTNITFSGGSIHDQWHDMFCPYSDEAGEVPSDFLIEDMTFYNLIPIEDVTGPNAHMDYIQSGGGGSMENTFDDFTVRGCTFHFAWEEWDWVGSSFGYNGLIFQHSGNNFTFENNLTYGMSSNAGFNVNGAVAGLVIRNNTFGHSSNNPTWPSSIDSRCTSVSHHNNIWHVVFRMNATASEVSQNNNIYNNYKDLSKPDMGSNSLEIGARAVEALFKDFDNGDYTLRKNVVPSAVNFGDPTHASGVDILGNSRDALPDAGCYEYVQADANNQAPVLQEIGNKDVNEGSVLTFTVTATDADGDTITYSIQNKPSGATFANQTFSWTPGYDEAGTYQVTFIASDGEAQDSETITITVNNVNRATMLSPIGNKSVDENSTLNFAVSASDLDGDPIYYSVDGLPSGAVFGNQTFTWTPGYSQAGAYSVTFSASDGQTPDSETITITVDNVNRSPVLSPIGDKSVYEGDSLTFTVSATDPDGDTITYSADSLPSGARLSSPDFSWTPSLDHAGNHPITFVASDGQLQDSESITITVNADTLAPTVTDCSPTADEIQVPLNNLIVLHIVDAGKGVDANTATIKVNDNIVYSGDTADYNSQYGNCHRTGTKSDYEFVYQSHETFDFDRTVSVTVDATDLRGNALSKYTYSFMTEMRSFGENKKVSSHQDSRRKGSPATVRDSSDNMWAVWDAGTTGSRDIYVGKLEAGADSFGSSVQLTDNAADQCNAAIAVDSDDRLYVAWQDNRRGDWDIYVSTSTDGVNWSAETRVIDSNNNQTNPVIIVDNSSTPNAYIACQDDRAGNEDIYVATSSNDFVTKTVSQVTTYSSNQTEPAIAVDSGNTVYIVWADARGSSNDIYGASSNNGLWTNVAIVSNANNQSSPAIATESTGSMLHLLWVDDTSGDQDIYCSASDGLPASPLTGESIVDEPGADQLSPAIIATSGTSEAGLKIFVCWQDKRNGDTDLYFKEVTSNLATNVLVGDDGANSDQSEPAIGIDEYDQPYVVWTDSRNGKYTEIYYSASTYMGPDALASKFVDGSKGATVGVKPGHIKSLEDISIIIPPAAYRFGTTVKISRIKNPQKSSIRRFGSPYDFGPSGINFHVPITINIPYDPQVSGSQPLVYWYDPLTGVLKQDDITNVTYIEKSPTLHIVRFKCRHFTQFHLGGGITVGGGGGGGGGGCSMSATSEGSIVEFVLPYVGLAVAIVIIKSRDARNRKARNITRSES